MRHEAENNEEVMPSQAGAFFFDLSTVEYSGIVQAAGEDSAAGDENVMSEAYVKYFGDRVREKLLVNAPTLHIAHEAIAAGTHFPLHRHNTNHAILVLEGSVHQDVADGAVRVLGQGMGLFMPADQDYSWTAGPEGCKFLDIHDNAMVLTFEREPPERWPAHRDAHPDAARGSQ